MAAEEAAAKAQEEARVAAEEAAAKAQEEARVTAEEAARIAAEEAAAKVAEEARIAAEEEAAKAKAERAAVEAAALAEVAPPALDTAIVSPSHLATGAIKPPAVVTMPASPTAGPAGHGSPGSTSSTNTRASSVISRIRLSPKMSANRWQSTSAQASAATSPSTDGSLLSCGASPTHGSLLRMLKKDTSTAASPASSNKILPGQSSVPRSLEGAFTNSEQPGQLSNQDIQPNDVQSRTSAQPPSPSLTAASYL